MLGVTLLAAVVAVGVFRNAVPYDGVLSWRQSSGLAGDYFGSVSYNPFVNIQQSLVNQSDADVFVATIDGDVPADQVYFRMLTLETYGGGQFFAQRPVVRSLEEGPWELDGLAFQIDQKRTFEHEEEFVLLIVLVPVEFAFQHPQANDTVIQAA